MIPFNNLALVNGPEVREALERVYFSDEYILGPEVAAFETEWAAYCGYKHCVGVGNGFDAMRLMLQAHGVKAGDEVIVPSNTYVATWMAVSAIGAIPVPVEPDESYTIDPERITQAVTKRTVAVLAVHLYGRKCDMEWLGLLCNRLGLALLTDCAQSHGIKECGDSGAFSFYPTKNLGCLGDGGAVVTNNDEVADRIRSLRNYGSVVKGENAEIGWNSRLDEMQAAVLRAKLPKLNAVNAIRAKVAAMYDAAFGVAVPKRHNVHHLYVMEHAARDWLVRQLQQRGIGAMVHYPIPPNKQQAYAGMYPSQPKAERIAERIVSLPVLVTEEQARQVASAVIDASGQWA